MTEAHNGNVHVHNDLWHSNTSLINGPFSLGVDPEAPVNRYYTKPNTQLLNIDKVKVITNTSHVIAKIIWLMTGANFTNMDHLKSQHW